MNLSAFSDVPSLLRCYLAIHQIFPTYLLLLPSPPSQYQTVWQGFIVPFPEKKNKWVGGNPQREFYSNNVHEHKEGQSNFPGRKEILAQTYKAEGIDLSVATPGNQLCYDRSFPCVLIFPEVAAGSLHFICFCNVLQSMHFKRDWCVYYSLSTSSCSLAFAHM